jgi:hypothetical protein
MANALFIVGLIITVAGLVFVILGYFQKTEAAVGPEGFGEDVGKGVEAITKLVEKVEKRFQLGLIVMAMGLTLIGVGAYINSIDAKDQADEAKDKATAAALVQRQS